MNLLIVRVVLGTPGLPGRARPFSQLSLVSPGPQAAGALFSLLLFIYVCPELRYVRRAVLLIRMSARGVVRQDKI